MVTFPFSAAKDEKAVDVFQSDTIWIGLLDKQTLDLTDAMGGIAAAYSAMYGKSSRS